MGKFTDEEINLAKKVQDVYGVPASITLAQYALESGYGKSTVGANNYFNIKGNGTGGYRDYSSKEDSFMDFGKLLSSKRYISKTKNATNAKEYIQGVKDAGYAEDSQYVSKVMSIINKNDLTKYDSGYSTTGKNSTASETDSNTVSRTTNSIGLKWWGDVVKVVIVILLVIGGITLLATSFGSIPTAENVIKKVKRGGKNGNK